MASGRELSQSTRVAGDANYVVQAGGDVVALPAGALIAVTEVAAPPGLVNMPLPPARFVGRTGYLDDLDAAITAPGPVVVAAVHGVGRGREIRSGCAVGRYPRPRARVHAGVVDYR